MATKEQLQEEIDLCGAKEANEHQIVLFNDDVNTFDHVVETLIQYVITLLSRLNSVQLLFIIKVNVLLKQAHTKI